jgi:hypothetical protein
VYLSGAEVTAVGAGREPADEIYLTWACRMAEHTMCSGQGFRLIPQNVDLPCRCTCHHA